jgi:hypothetical protein
MLDFYTSLPPQYTFTARALQLRAFSPTRTPFMMLHIFWHQCHCDLYRILVPGFRESVSRDVLTRVSPEFLHYFQSKCVEHAVAAGNIILTCRRVIQGPLVTDQSLGFCLYQCSCALLLGCHQDVISGGVEPTTARDYLKSFCDAVADLMRYYRKLGFIVSRSATANTKPLSCLGGSRKYLQHDDIRNMLRHVEEHHLPGPR